jgi:hypothetical protein
MDNAKIVDLLRDLKACPEAIYWLGTKTFSEAWDSCERADWMLWLCTKMQDKHGWPTRQEIVLVACVCAETVLPIFEKKYPNDDRPRKVIETARLWAQGKATMKEVRSAANAAADARQKKRKELAGIVRSMLKVPADG